MTRRLSLLLPLVLLSVGCATRGPYRLGPPAKFNSPGPNTSVVEDHGAYKLGFIEFSDEGKRLRDDWQLKEVVSTIRHARHLTTAGSATPETGGGMTVIYVHGWKNNARSSANQTKDVEKFRNFLETVAAKVPSGTPVNGVYLVWNGKTFDIDSSLLNWWTLWPRYFAAGRVGSREMARTISQLIAAGVAGRGEQIKAHKPRPRVILIGHSLGARVLENALERVPDDAGLSSLLAEEEAAGFARPDPSFGVLLGQCKSLGSGKPVKSIVDLTLLVNEANKSRQVRAASAVCAPGPNGAMLRHPGFSQDLCPDNPSSQFCQPYPLFVHIASSADWATRFLARFALLGGTAPHSPSLVTHRVTEGNPAGPSLFQFWTESQITYSVSRKPNVSDRNPIWVMRVNGKIIKNHGDIWNLNFQNMILALIGGLDAETFR